MRKLTRALLVAALLVSTAIFTACDSDSEDSPAQENQTQQPDDTGVNQQNPSTPSEQSDGDQAATESNQSSTTSTQSNDSNSNSSSTDGGDSATQSGDETGGDVAQDDAPAPAQAPKSTGSWMLEMIGLAGLDLGIPLSSINPALFGISAQLVVRNDGTATITLQLPDDLNLLASLVGDIDPALVAQLEGQALTISGTWQETSRRVALTLTSSSAEDLIPAGEPISATVGVVSEGQQLALLVTAADLGLQDEMPGATLTLEFKRE